MVCDSSVKLAGMCFVQLAFWKGLPDALHTCCCPAGDYNERECTVFTECLLGARYCVGGWVLEKKYEKETPPPNNTIFKTSHMQKESFNVR